MSTIFSSVQPSIVVCQNEDGSYAWFGQYNGMSIKQAIPMDGGAHCILLFDPDASDCLTFRNLLCIDVNGQSIWNAELPASPDAFLDVSLSSEGLLARTWSGMQVILDRNSGRELDRKINK